MDKHEININPNPYLRPLSLPPYEIESIKNNVNKPAGISDPEVNNNILRLFFAPENKNG